MNYLIIRNDGIGDLIVSTPLITEIRKIDKEAVFYLICSNRNVDFGKMLLNDDFIHFLLNGDEYKFRLVRFYKIISKLSYVKFESIFILKSNYFNVLIAIFLRAKKIHSIIFKNLSKNKKIRYTPFLKLSKSIFESYEIIDSSNDFENNFSKHMSDHFFSLLHNSFSSSKQIKLPRYYEPKVINLFTKKLNEHCRNKNNLKKILIFHLDEKWNNAKLSNNEFIDLFKSIQEIFKGLIIITNGIKFNKYENNLIKEFKFNQKIDLGDINSDLNIVGSSELDNLYFIDNLKIQELFALIKISSLVIEYHGALTHIASIYNVPLIDLIDYRRKNFFYKWKPKSDKSCQIDVNNSMEIILKLKEYLEIN